jgi:hypothetical protein
MRSWRWKFPPVLLGGLALALVALAPPAALGQVNEECNGFIDLDYDPPPVISVPPFNVNVRITLGGGQIIGGPGSPMITYPFVHFWLDCVPPVPPTLAPPCADDGSVMFKGPITTDCPGVTWTANVGASGHNNLVTFTPTPAVTSPPDTPEPVGFCKLEFPVTVVAAPSKGTCSGDTATCNLGGPNTCPIGQTCNEEIPQIADYLNLSASGIDPNQDAFCNNGLTSGGFQTTAIGSKPIVTTDYDCYEADSTFSSSGHTLTDVFGTFTNVQVGAAQRCCAPAVKVTDPTTPVTLLPEHLVGYVITSTLKRDVSGVKVNSPQFGVFTVHVTKVAGKAALLVPSNKTVEPNPPPPQDLNPTNHFLCYNFDTLTGGIPGPVMVRDQFNPNPPGTKLPQIVTFTKQKSWRLCVPVDKDGLDPSAPTNKSGLLCLVTGPDMQSPLNHTFVNWSNQFQHPATNVHLDKLDDFCVPATVTP